MRLNTKRLMIQVQALVKSFGYQVALRGIDLRVAEGEFLTLLGPNGAGKTTLLRLLATLSQPTAGSIRVAGHDVAQAAGRVRRLIGLVSHQSLLYNDLSAEANLRFYAQMYGLSRPQARIDEVLDLVGLSARRVDLVRTFSRGMQQRLSIARAILHRPQVMLFDEPYTGLDHRAAAILSQVLESVAGAGRTVLLTTHNLERGLAACDRVIVLHRGKVVHRAERADIDPANFAGLYQSVTS